MRRNDHLGFYKHGNLPHLDADGAVQFLTFVLADAAPPFRNPHAASIAGNSGLELFSRLDWKLEQGGGRCILRDPANAQDVVSAIMTNAGLTHRPLAYVVMPNHVHLLTRQLRGHGLGKVVNQIKSLSARRMNLRTSCEGKLWQRGYFDRVMRNMDQLRMTIRYIHENPVRAGLVEHAGQWPFSTARDHDETKLEEALSVS